MSWLESVFGPGTNISAAQECARAAFIFGYGFLLVRLAGRRIFAQWSALDIVVAIIAGSNLSRAITGPVPLFGTMAATAVLVALHWLFAKVGAHSKLADRLIEGEPVELGSAGTVNEQRLKRWSITGTALEEAMRRSKVKSLGGMESIILEPSGRIHVTKAD
jgi:uncharacterized membrane protein YcaP (DUF421 family)